MLDNLYQNWPIFLLGGAFVVFSIYAIINGRQQEKKDKEAEKKKEDVLLKK